MKKISVIAVFTLLAVFMFANGVMASLHMGPAPNSGDCIPDGPGWDRTDMPSKGKGPAPNSGDGIPDGPGW